MIIEYLKSFAVLTDDEIDNLMQCATKSVLNKLDYFIREGETCKEVAFIVAGTLRSFHMSPTDEEITYCITFPNNLMTAYSSFITGQSTSENIQAITPVELIIIPKNHIEKLSTESVNWIKFMKIIAEQQYVELEKRVFQLQKLSATQRYTELIKNRPEYIQNIPLQYLASYLGITQRHLSRIRKEISY